MIRYVRTAVAAPATAAARAAWTGDGLSPDTRLATAALRTPAICSQLEVVALRPLEEPDDWPLDELDPRRDVLDPLCDEPDDCFERAPDELPVEREEPPAERDEDPERAVAISRSVFAPASRWKRPLRSRG